MRRPREAGPGPRRACDPSFSPAPRTRLSRSPRLRALTAVLLLSPAAACSRDLALDPTVPQANDRSNVPHVVVVSVDGLRPDAIGAAGAATMQQLIREGAASLTAQTVTPSITLPSHVSMFTGVTPARHGITWNDDRIAQYGPVKVATVFDAARDAGFTSAMFGGKSKLGHLLRPETPMRASLPPRDSIWYADRVSDRVVEYLRLGRPEGRADVMFVHLPDADLAGHADGWMSASYLAGVRRADAGIARIWQALRQAYGSDFTLIVTADHGGVGHNHNDGSPEATTIPWIAWGWGVQPQTLPAGIRTVDTAATVLWILGVATPNGWDGTPVRGAFKLPVAR